MIPSSQPAGKSWKDLPNDWCVNVKDNGGSFKVIDTSPDGAVLSLPPQCSAPRPPRCLLATSPALRNNHRVEKEHHLPTTRDSPPCSHLCPLRALTRHVASLLHPRQILRNTVDVKEYLAKNSMDPDIVEVIDFSQRFARLVYKGERLPPRCPSLREAPHLPSWTACAH